MMKDRKKERLKLLSLIVPMTALVGLGGKLITVLNGYQDEILGHEQAIKQLYVKFDEAKHYKQLAIAEQDKKIERLQDSLNHRMSRIEDNLINLMFRLDFKTYPDRKL